jgi:hypothetical protein
METGRASVGLRLGRASPSRSATTPRGLLSLVRAAAMLECKLCLLPCIAVCWRHVCVVFLFLWFVSSRFPKCREQWISFGGLTLQAVYVGISVHFGALIQASLHCRFVLCCCTLDMIPAMQLQTPLRYRHQRQPRAPAPPLLSLSFVTRPLSVSLARRAAA